MLIEFGAYRSSEKSEELLLSESHSARLQFLDFSAGCCRREHEIFFMLSNNTRKITLLQPQNRTVGPAKYLYVAVLLNVEFLMFHSCIICSVGLLDEVKRWQKEDSPRDGSVPH